MDLGLTDVVLVALAVAFMVTLAVLRRLPEDADDDARAETHPAPTPRAILRQLAHDTYAYVVLWIVLTFAAQVLGRELPDSAVDAIAVSIAGFVVLDATRLLLRRYCASRAIRP